MAGELIEHHVKPEGEFYVVRGELADAVLYGHSWSLTSEYRAEGADEFLREFELVGTDFLGDPADDFYQVINFTTVYKRLRDGALFGCSYYQSPGNDSMKGGSSAPDAESFGVSVDWENDEPEPLILLPVRSFMRLGYEVVTP